jgi:hypothetical protein
MAIWYILWPFGILYGYLVYFMAIWYMYFMAILCYFLRTFGMLQKEKSGNPGIALYEG